jgi:hypothetical protein
MKNANPLLAFLGGSVAGLLIALVIAALFVFGLDYLVAHFIAQSFSEALSETVHVPPKLMQSIYYGVVFFFVFLWWHLNRKTLPNGSYKKSQRARSLHSDCLRCYA